MSAEIDAELAMVAEDHRKRAAADLEVQRKSAWTAEIVKAGLAAKVPPSEVYSPAYLESQLAMHQDPADFPPGVSPSDFAAWAELNDCSPVLYLGADEPPMLRDFRKLREQRQKMANI
jgi:hypothetical protein